MALSDAILTRLLSLHPKIIDLSLDRMLRLLEDLGNPQDRLPPVIHIAGTNGKGLTAAPAGGTNCAVVGVALNTVAANGNITVAVTPNRIQG